MTPVMRCLPSLRRVSSGQFPEVKSTVNNGVLYNCHCPTFGGKKMKCDELAEKLQSVYDHQDPENHYRLF